MAKLILNPSSHSKREVSLPRTVLTIGRDPSNDLVLPDAMVSRRHAVVEFRARQYFLRDCNSSNGSLVNGDRVSERGLRDGDLVAIGTARLVFRDDIEVLDGLGKVVQHPSAPRLRCQQCGADHRHSDAFCQQCGATLQGPPPRPVCASCGTVLEQAARFCGACGAELPAARDAEDARQRSRGEGAAAAEGPAPVRPRAVALSVGGASPVLETEWPVGRPTRREWRTSAPSAAARPGADPTLLLPRAIAGLLDALAVLLGQSLLLSPVVRYWWTRDLAAEPAFAPVLLSVVLVLLSAALGALYYVYFWGARGATPGKMLLGLRVVAADGSFPIGASRAAARLVGCLVSGALLGLGFLLIAIDGQGLHDRIAGTRVVARDGD